MALYWIMQLCNEILDWFDGLALSPWVLDINPGNGRVPSLSSKGLFPLFPVAGCRMMFYRDI